MRIRIDKLAAASEVDEICASCGLSHKPEARLRRLKRMLPATAEDIVSAFPCTYRPKGMGKAKGDRDHMNSDNRMLYRDLNALGAHHEGGIWNLDK